MDATQKFADALQRLEQDRSLDELLELFAEDAELHRPETGTVLHGREGARSFWQSYLEQFEAISSTFSRVHEAGELGELEWTSEGRLAGGEAVTYTGCSLLVLSSDGQVNRFATYYDTAPFVTG
jgi:ketosteroid isomerase-like protein